MMVCALLSIFTTEGLKMCCLQHGTLKGPLSNNLNGPGSKLALCLLCLSLSVTCPDHYAVLTTEQEATATFILVDLKGLYGVICTDTCMCVCVDKTKGDGCNVWSNRIMGTKQKMTSISTKKKKLGGTWKSEGRHRTDLTIKQTLELDFLFWTVWNTEGKKTKQNKIA